jgi:hypothetical protein
MPKAARDTVEHVEDFGVVEDRHTSFGEYTVNFVTFREEADHAPLLRGLPDDRCQCPHWGYVVAGRMTVRYADGEETLAPGDAFYLPPGHVPVAAAGTEIVLFSPTEEMKATDEAMMRNLQALQGVR